MLAAEAEVKTCVWALGFPSTMSHGLVRRDGGRGQWQTD
jgi:hypothetical protein